MEKPDAQGYVHINWPSKNIPHGGVFHTRRVEPTVKQQEFLKVLLEESKLAIAQRKQYMLRQEEERKPEPEIRMPLVRPRTSKRRSLSAIRESGIYDDEPFKPIKRGEDREKLKEKLAFTMQYGEGPDQVPPPPPRLPKPQPKVLTSKEKWNDLVSQIRERVDWLAEMEELGQAAPHREAIEAQIVERMRAMDALGIDSECSSARSGFSTLRSREIIPSARSNGSNRSKGSNKSVKSVKSNKSITKVDTTRTMGSQDKPQLTGKKVLNEENVAAYQGHMTPLKYSPRRRV